MSNTVETPASETRCLRCGRTLRVSQGYGPRCAAKIRKAALDAARAGFTPDQQAKAGELIRDGGAVEIAPGLYAIVSSDGEKTYACDGHSCTCDAGWCDKRCWHLLTARILDLSRRTLPRRSSMAKAA